jgi:hypothetical protein
MPFFPTNENEGGFPLSKETNLTPLFFGYVCLFLTYKTDKELDVEFKFCIKVSSWSESLISAYKVRDGYLLKELIKLFKCIGMLLISDTIASS